MVRLKRLLPKFTFAEKLVPGLALESLLCDQLIIKERVVLNSSLLKVLLFSVLVF